MSAIKLVVCGAAGRMGMRILNLASQDKKFQVVGAVEAKDRLRSSEKSKTSGLWTDDLKTVIQKADVVIDFTVPSATERNLDLAKAAKKAIVIGTTGLEDRQKSAAAKAAKSIPIVLAPNMSVGVNLLFALAAQAAKVLKDYHVEILEVHHAQKKDAPSGTALKLAEIIAQTLGRDLKKTMVTGRSGQVGARRPEEIGVMSLRLGDTIGDHTVHFGSPGERIELTHRASSRDTFVSGALAAARWVVGQKPGLYDMMDVLGLKRA